jgi:hypothetical protein
MDGFTNQHRSQKYGKASTASGIQDARYVNPVGVIGQGVWRLIKEMTYVESVGLSGVIIIGRCFASCVKSKQDKRSKQERMKYNNRKETTLWKPQNK